VESFSSLNNRPIVFEAQCKEIGSQAQLSNKGGRVSDAGTSLGGTRDLDGDVDQSSTSKSEREAQPLVESLMEGSKGVSSPPLWVEKSQSKQNICRTTSTMEGCGGDSRKKTLSLGSGGEDP